MLEGKGMWQPQKQSDFNQSSLTFLFIVPVRSLPSSMADVVPCNRLLQKAYCLTHGQNTMTRERKTIHQANYSDYIAVILLTFKLIKSCVFLL